MEVKNRLKWVIRFENFPNRLIARIINERIYDRFTSVSKIPPVLRIEFINHPFGNHSKIGSMHNTNKIKRFTLRFQAVTKPMDGAIIFIIIYIIRYNIDKC